MGSRTTSTEYGRCNSKAFSKQFHHSNTHLLIPISKFFQYYQFTYFAMTLNEMPDLKPPARLCPTDSRYRPDVRKLESGDLDGAASEKTRLEEKQRDSRKAMKSRKEEWKPRFESIHFISLKQKTNEDVFCFFQGGLFRERIHTQI